MPVPKPTLFAIAATSLFAGASGCSDGGHAPRAGSIGALNIDQSTPQISFAAASDIQPAAAPSTDSYSPVAIEPFNRRLGEHLGVLTFNMEHRDQPQQLAIMGEHLRSDLRELPDFILCQEVKFNRAASKGQSNTAEVLADTIGYHTRATKRTSDNEGVAILSRYPFDFYDSRQLKSQTSPLLLGFNRVSVMAEFTVPAVGVVRLVNVHLTNWRFEERVRTNQLRETLQWISEREQTVHADITILGGDFNMLPNGDERPLVSDIGETGNLQFLDFNTSDPTRGAQGHPSMRVDYMFVASPKCDVKFLGEDRLFKNGLRDERGHLFYLSDHVPVLHQYAVKSHGTPGGGGGGGTATVQAAPDPTATLVR